MSEKVVPFWEEAVGVLAYELLHKKLFPRKMRPPLSSYYARLCYNQFLKVYSLPPLAEWGVSTGGEVAVYLAGLFKTSVAFVKELWLWAVETAAALRKGLDPTPPPQEPEVREPDQPPLVDTLITASQQEAQLPPLPDLVFSDIEGTLREQVSESGLGFDELVERALGERIWVGSAEDAVLEREWSELQQYLLESAGMLAESIVLAADALNICTDELPNVCRRLADLLLVPLVSRLTQSR